MQWLRAKLSRRDTMKHLGLLAAVAALPLGRLGKRLADEERKRRRAKELDQIGNIWIGHC